MTETTNKTETTYTLRLRYEADGRIEDRVFDTPAAAHNAAKRLPAAYCTLYSETDRGSRWIESWRN